MTKDKRIQGIPFTQHEWLEEHQWYTQPNDIDGITISIHEHNANSRLIQAAPEMFWQILRIASRGEVWACEIVGKILKRKVSYHYAKKLYERYLWELENYDVECKRCKTKIKKNALRKTFGSASPMYLIHLCDKKCLDNYLETPIEGL